MKVALKLPLFGMNMEEATIVKWYKRPGETFVKGEALYDLETEKVTTAVEAPCDGKMLEIFADLDATVKVGEAVCSIEWS